MAYEQLTEMPTKEALDRLMSTTCYCGKSKAPKRSHCRTCYYKLPPAMRQALYRLIRDGYEEAYLESCQFLYSAHAEKV